MDHCHSVGSLPFYNPYKLPPVSLPLHLPSPQTLPSPTYPRFHAARCPQAVLFHGAAPEHLLKGCLLGERDEGVHEGLVARVRDGM